jgi:tetraacyldisaccharide 4'-kinase
MSNGLWLVQTWYHKHWIRWLLLPLSWLFCAIASLRRFFYQCMKPKPYRVSLIVVGNIVLGGSGKTPLIISLVKYLKQEGYQPAVVSRGYGARPEKFPHVVLLDQDSIITGDEPLLIARATQVPVVIDPKRVRAVEYLLKQTSCDVILSDDGLQHYAMHRDIEIAVLDGQRRLGNGLCLPAGPLREAASRLKSVDFVVSNGGAAEQGEYTMQLQPTDFVNIKNKDIKQSLTGFKGKSIHAVAGIGNPGRFFKQLTALGCQVIEHAFPDHHAYQAHDLSFGDQLAVVMTEKDAVKCKGFAQDHWWYLPVEAKLPEKLLTELLQKIQRKQKNG